MNPKMPTSRYISIEMAKVKDKKKILKAAGERLLPVSLFTNKNISAKKALAQSIQSEGKQKDLQPRLLYLEGYHFKLNEK